MERVPISVEGVIPDRCVSFLVVYLERPVEVGSGRTVNAQDNGYVIIDKFAGEF
ncbi:hypothetical protein SF83666_c13700 [Sinorhizobium fredii CCBAU 83666]|nr:hypothetical protein SF83666_c13700 [Sinorhizobium fredii CCBAU 83666]